MKRENECSIGCREGCRMNAWHRLKMPRGFSGMQDTPRTGPRAHSSGRAYPNPPLRARSVTLSLLFLI